MLALDRPGDNDIEKTVWGMWTDIVLTVIFSLKAMLKLLALGPSYLFDVWNVLDVVVVGEGWISIFGRGGGFLKVRVYFSHCALFGWPFDRFLFFFQVLRCFRVLRPLRTVKRFPSLRILT